MKKIFLIIGLVFAAHWLSGQIITNTPFKINSNNPIDDRYNIATLSDTSTILFKWNGLITKVLDTGQRREWNGVNWAIYDPGGVSGSEYYAFTASEPDTSLLWIDQTTYDSTGVFEVKDYGIDAWATVAWYDSVGNVFSNQKPLYFAISGQSNSRPRIFEPERAASSYVSYYDTISGNWEYLDLPEAMFEDANGTNWWAKDLANAAAVEGRIVKLVHWAESGVPITNWHDPNYKIYSVINSSKVPYLDALFFYQGESDANNTLTQYAIEWDSMYTLFKALPEWTDNTQMITIELCTESSSKMNSYINTLSIDSLQQTKVVHNADNTRIDILHIDSQGHLRLGKRAWETFKKGSDQYFGPNVLFQFKEVSDTVDFEIASYFNISNSTDTLSFVNKKNGFVGGIRINDVDSSGVQFTENAYCVLSDRIVPIDAIYKSFTSNIYVSGDSIFFTSYPVFFSSPADIGALPEVGSKLYGWWDMTITDNVVLDGSNKVQEVTPRAGTGSRSLVQTASGDRLDYPVDSLMNGYRSVYSDGTGKWLNLDVSTATGMNLDANAEFWIVLQTSDQQGNVVQGETAGSYGHWDSAESTNSLIIQNYIDNYLSSRRQDSLAARIATGEIVIIRAIVNSNAFDGGFRIMDYANNVGGHGVNGKVSDVFLYDYQLTTQEVTKTYNYLVNKYQQDLIPLFSNIGESRFDNPYETGDNLDATIASIKVLTDASIGYVELVDTIDFSRGTVFRISNSVDTITFQNKVNGFTGEIRINDIDSSGVYFPDTIYAITEERAVPILEIFEEFSSGIYISNDSVFLTNYPTSFYTQYDGIPVYGSKLYGWWDMTIADSITLDGSQLVQEVKPLEGTGNRSLIQTASGDRLSYPADSTINTYRSVYSDGTGKWLELDVSTATGMNLDASAEMWIVLETMDSVGNVFQGETAGTFLHWDKNDASATLFSNIWVNNVVVPNRMDSVWAHIAIGTPVIVRVNVNSNAFDGGFRIMDYANNTGGHGVDGKVSEVIMYDFALTAQEVSQTYNFLSTKYLQDQSPVFSDVGKYRFDNPYETGGNLDATIASIKAAIDVQTDDQTADEVSVAATPSNYTAGSATVEAHLAGIDDVLGDINNLGNVDITTPSDGQFLQYQSITSTWDNVSISTTDDQTAGEVNITDVGSHYTGTTVEAALQELGFESFFPSNAGTQAITKKENFIIIQDLNGSTQTQTITTAAATNGTRLFIKSDAATSVTFTSGSFIPLGSVTGSTTFVISGIGEAEFMFSGGTWWQIN